MARIAFFGTPPLAATQLSALLASGHTVAVAVAQPDRPSGRGQKLQPPPVKLVAQQHDVAVLQPSTLKRDTEDGEQFFAAFSALEIDLAIVAAYGRIIPQRLLDVPKCGMVNVHGSLLPRWRGAAPIQRALQAGDATTGVCLMQMVKALDAGDVYARDEFPINPFDDGETLMARVADAGAALLLKHLDALLAQKLPCVPQDSDGVTYAHQLTKEEGRLDFTQPARRVTDTARAMHPWPGAFTHLRGEVLKLFRPRRVTASGAPGTLVGLNDGIVIACADGAVAFGEAQLAGKNRVPAHSLVHGRVLALGDRVGDAVS